VIGVLLLLMGPIWFLQGANVSCRQIANDWRPAVGIGGLPLAGLALLVVSRRPDRDPWSPRLNFYRLDSVEETKSTSPVARQDW
jgi:hypothetical protein